MMKKNLRRRKKNWISSYRSKKMENIDQKIEKLERKVKMYKIEIRKNANKEKNLKRKARVHKLIQKGALFEILKLLEEDQETLLGYLSKFNSLTSEEKKKYFSIGKNIFDERKRKKEIGIEKNNGITTSQIIKLIELARVKNFDLVDYMQINFKKKLLENLSVKEYELILSKLNS